MTPLEAMQQTLAGEHAAIYVYGVVGGRVSDSQQPTLAAEVAAGYARHRAHRDRLRTMVTQSGGTPVAAEVAYALPTPCRTEAELGRAVLLVEQRCAEAYATMVGATSRAARGWAIDALVDASVRVLTDGGQAEAFPGIREL
jgi:hypothetical protein